MSESSLKSLFQEFNANNPGLSTDKENIELHYTLGGDEYESKVFIDDEFQFSSTMKYSGISQNAYGQEGDEDHMKYTIETVTGQVTKQPSITNSNIPLLIQSRMPGMTHAA